MLSDAIGRNVYFVQNRDYNEILGRDRSPYISNYENVVREGLIVSITAEAYIISTGFGKEPVAIKHDLVFEREYEAVAAMKKLENENS